MIRISMSTISIAALAALAGCSAGPDVVATGTQGEEPSTQTANLDQTAPAEVSTLSVSGFVHGPDGAALSGVKVCLQAGPISAMDVGDCATSDVDGAFTVGGIPANELLTIGFEKAGFEPTIRAIETGTEDIVLPDDENVLAPRTTVLGSTQGRIEFVASAGTTVTLTGDDGQVRTPSYGDAGGENPTVRGVFTDLAPGYYYATFQNSSANCTNRSGLYAYPLGVYQAPGQATVIVPVAPGLTTASVAVDCE